jgi:hypothetical protein
VYFTGEVPSKYIFNNISVSNTNISNNKLITNNLYIY